MTKMPPTPSTRLSDLPSRTAAVLLLLAAPASAASRAPPPASPGDTRKAASSPLRRSPRAHAPAGGFGAAAEAGLPSPASNLNRVEGIHLSLLLSLLAPRPRHFSRLEIHGDLIDFFPPFQSLSFIPFQSLSFMRISWMRGGLFVALLVQLNLMLHAIRH
ncbi:hypothetical protein [Oryza sativa Japonica Group]|uniref:Uncharacterized protein n=1 Tax=Oryza sativa subsp. japonica TaxID=39947 RepID=Q5ZB63_ORYSJ|nr:hypothetical protein [Oryza sativa Japonica Group]BAD53168.1 hypothetical protein [Oryza sativa Japonica Group]